MNSNEINMSLLISSFASPVFFFAAIPDSATLPDSAVMPVIEQRSREYGGSLWLINGSSMVKNVVNQWFIYGQ